MTTSILPPRLILPRAWLSVLLAALACSADPAQSSGGSAAPRTTATATAAASARPPRDPAWETAHASGDALDIAALARIESAPQLLRDIDDATFGETARAALLQSRDAELVFGALAARVRAGGGSAEHDAELFLALVSLESPFGERLDPDGEAQALAELDEVARDVNRAARLRALAISIERRLVERGVGSASAIFTDLDREP